MTLRYWFRDSESKDNYLPDSEYANLESWAKKVGDLLKIDVIVYNGIPRCGGVGYALAKGSGKKTTMQLHCLELGSPEINGSKEVVDWAEVSSEKRLEIEAKLQKALEALDEIADKFPGKNLAIIAESPWVDLLSSAWRLGTTNLTKITLDQEGLSVEGVAIRKLDDNVEIQDLGLTREERKNWLAGWGSMTGTLG